MKTNEEMREHGTYIIEYLRDEGCTPNEAFAIIEAILVTMMATASFIQAMNGGELSS